MRDLHTRLAEVNRKYGLDRGDDIHETGARHRSTAEYNRDLHRENAKLEILISDKSGLLSQLEDQIKKAETRVKGLTTMIANLERQEAELNDEIAQLETDIAHTSKSRWAARRLQSGILRLNLLSVPMAWIQSLSAYRQPSLRRRHQSVSYAPAPDVCSSIHNNHFEHYRVFR